MQIGGVVFEISYVMRVKCLHFQTARHCSMHGIIDAASLNPSRSFKARLIILFEDGLSNGQWTIQKQRSSVFASQPVRGCKRGKGFGQAMRIGDAVISGQEHSGSRMFGMFRQHARDND